MAKIVNIRRDVDVRTLHCILSPGAAVYVCQLTRFLWLFLRINSIVTKCPSSLPRLKAKATESKLCSRTYLMSRDLLVGLLPVRLFLVLPWPVAHVESSLLTNALSGTERRVFSPRSSLFCHGFVNLSTDPTKFFGCELGAQTPMDEKNDRYIVNGAHEATRLRELLDGFIDKFVLCGACKNPETDLILEPKSDYIYRDCKACGKKSDIDMRHKLATYIIRNPPKTAKGKKAKGAHASASATNGNGSGEDGDTPNGDGDDDDDAFMKKIKSQAAGLPTAEQATMDENDWSLDTSADAVRARAKLVGQMGGLSVGDDDDEEDDADSPYSQLKVWATENRGEASAVEVYKKAQELGIEKKHKTVQVLARSLLTADAVKELPANILLFKKVLSSMFHFRVATHLPSKMNYPLMFRVLV